VTQVRFFKSRARKRIAFADEGEGPIILLPAWWVSHLEKDAEDPAYRHFFGRLTSLFRVVRYDRVGVGLSDRTRDRFTLTSELSDFTDLVEHLGMPRFHLLGFSCAGPLAPAYAAKNPDRVDRIILYGSYLRHRDEACAAVYDGGPGALPFSMFDDEQRREVCDEFVASLEPYRRGTAFEVPAEFVYASARLPRHLPGPLRPNVMAGVGSDWGHRRTRACPSKIGVAFDPASNGIPTHFVAADDFHVHEFLLTPVPPP